MPEGLKNADATFARIIMVLGSQRNIIAYVDNIVLMIRNKEDRIQDLKETFANL